MAITAAAAVSDVDPFCDGFLSHPYPFHEALREAGAIVWLERYGIFASARHAEVQTALTDWQNFSSAAGVGIDDFRRGLYAFAANPGEWRALRENPSLVRSAFDEILRWEAPVQTFFRTTTTAVELGGVALPADAKILLFLAAANRDPRRWDDPERFDVRRRASGHVAFGAGIHMCVGQMLARLESELVLAALLARVARIEIAGEPKRKLNNTLRQFASLPIELTPA
jgi:4-methoxybenzoate monooxygenase (O-demethylating)